MRGGVRPPKQIGMKSGVVGRGSVQAVVCLLCPIGAIAVPP